MDRIVGGEEVKHPLAWMVLMRYNLGKILPFNTKIIQY
jgi:hypothetical protein